jgi:hypothetical protein
MRWAFYKHNRDNQPDILDTEIKDLADFLLTERKTSCSQATCQGKNCPHKNCEAWSPAYIEGERKSENVKAITAGVFDLDAYRPGTSDFEERLANADVSGLIHSTHNHRSDSFNLRLVLWFRREVLPEEWQPVWNALIRKFNIPCDPVCKDLARLYYFPTTPSDCDFFGGVLPGNTAIDIDALLDEKVKSPDVSTTVLTKPPIEPKDHSEFISYLSRNYAPEGLRNEASLALTGGLVRAGWTTEEAARFTYELHSVVNKRDGEYGKRLYQAERARDRIAKGEETVGFKKLQECKVSEGIVNHISDYANSYVRERNHRFLQALNIPEPDDIFRDSRISNVASEDRPPVKFYPTGFSDLDVLIGGGIRTRVINILCGPPGSGKSAWLIDRALVMQDIIPVILIGSELDRQEVVARSQANLLGIGSNDILFGKANPKAADLSKHRIHVFDFNTIPFDNVEGFIEHLIERCKGMYGQSPMIILDYMQDFTRGGSDEVRIKVGNLSKALRGMVQKHDCAMIIASSVARNFYGNDNYRASEYADIYLNAAKESGDIDFDAAFIFYLDVDRDRDAAGLRLSRLAVAKARGGMTGFVGLKFEGRTGKWFPYPKAVEELKEKGVSVGKKKAPSEDSIKKKIKEEIIRAYNEEKIFKYKSGVIEALGGDRNRNFDILNKMIENGELEVKPDTKDLQGKSFFVGLVGMFKSEEPKTEAQQEVSSIVNKFLQRN